MIKTYSFEGGKYEVDREVETNFVVAVRRGGEDWPIMFGHVQYQAMFYSMLNHIDALEIAAAKVQLGKAACAEPDAQGKIRGRKITHAIVDEVAAATADTRPENHDWVAFVGWFSEARGGSHAGLDIARLAWVAGRTYGKNLAQEALLDGDNPFSAVPNTIRTRDEREAYRAGYQAAIDVLRKTAMKVRKVREADRASVKRIMEDAEMTLRPNQD